MNTVTDQDISMYPPPGPLPQPTSPLTPVAGQKRRRSPRPGPEEAGSSQTHAVATPQPTPDPSGMDLRPVQRQRIDSSQPNTARTATALRGRKRKGKRPNDWHITKKDVPEAARKVKVRRHLI